MSKIINFIYENSAYIKILDTLVDPIAKYLVGLHEKTFEFQKDMLNVCFFCDSPKTQRRGIFMSHGIADKNWRNFKSVCTYDYVCVSSEAWKQKMINQGMPSEKLLICGYTKLDTLFPVIHEELYSDKIVVLYAPTHNMGDPLHDAVSCFPRLNKYFEHHPIDIRIIDSVHPANKEDGVPTMSLYKYADVVISDCSSTLYEAMALGIPVVFPDWLVCDCIYKCFPTSFEETIYKKQIGYHANNIDEFWELIRKAKNEGLNEKTKKFIDSIIPPQLRGNSGKVTADILIQLSNS
jgi:hypothetical protein